MVHITLWMVALTLMSASTLRFIYVVIEAEKITLAAVLPYFGVTFVAFFMWFFFHIKA